VYRILMGRPEGKTPLGKPRRKWEDGIRMDLREIGWVSVDWIQLAQDRDWWWPVVNTVMNLRVLVPCSSYLVSYHNLGILYDKRMRQDLSVAWLPDGGTLLTDFCLCR
jgi:hypothetical protein